MIRDREIIQLKNYNTMDTKNSTYTERESNSDWVFNMCINVDTKMNSTPPGNSSVVIINCD